MIGSLKATSRYLLLDLGAVRPLFTEAGPRQARYVLILAEKGPRPALPRGEALVYRVAADPLDFAIEEGAVIVGGVAVFLTGPPEYVFTPYYVWTEG